MTTIVFYKGTMVADSLQTECTFSGSKNLDAKDFEFKLVQKIYHIIVDSKTHIIGSAGEVSSIVAFLDAYRKNELANFKPNDDFRAIDFDGEKLVVWYVADKSIKLLNLIPFVNISYKHLKTTEYKYDENQEVVYVIGSGADFTRKAYKKLKFQFQMLGEKIEDHLKPIEIATYLIKVAALCDRYTNDKISWSTKTDTSVSPQNASLLKG